MQYDNIIGYPLFQLFNEQAIDSNGNTRTREEARKYFSSFLRVYPLRIILLLDWLQEKLSYNAPEDLLRIGEKVVGVISNPILHTYSEDRSKPGDCDNFTMSSKILRTEAHSICIDMGLLLALYLTQLESPLIRWNLVERSPKYINYHHIVVSGPADHLDYNPIFDSIGWCNSFINGIRLSGRIWSEFYLMWCDVLEGRTPRDLRNV
jgi:hypothetical protein